VLLLVVLQCLWFVVYLEPLGQQVFCKNFIKQSRNETLVIWQTRINKITITSYVKTKKEKGIGLV
jgi:hypothetical protein